MGVFLVTLSLWITQGLAHGGGDHQHSPEEAWKTWKSKAYKNALESPTSFLNAYFLEQELSGKSLYLILGKDKASTRWVKKQPKKFYGMAEHLGEKVRIQIKGATIGYLTNEKDNRRKKIELPNGAIAEVVYGRRNKKLWTYLYDPEQIKSFSGFRFYPFDEGAITTGIFKAQKPRFVSYKTVQGDPTQVNQIGNISFKIRGKEFYLPAYNWQKKGEKLRYVAMVFTDNTKGKETYGGGREVVVDLENGIKDGQKLTIDFNRTVNFYCAHSPFWHCPVGLQKHMDVSVKAGEMLPLRKIIK